MNEISPRNTFVPRFQTTAKPMLSMKNTGMRNESIVSSRTIVVSRTAIAA